MKKKQEIEDKIKELEVILYVELSKPNLDQRPVVSHSCEHGIQYLKWVIEK